MAGRVVEVKVIFLDVLAVIPLVTCQAKHPLLEKWIVAVPQRQRETKILVPVAYSTQTIFIPAVGPGTSVIVWEVIPGVAIGTVVLAHCAPGALRQKWSPAIPVASFLLDHYQPNAFSGVVDAHPQFLSSATRNYFINPVLKGHAFQPCRKWPFYGPGL